MRVIHTAVICWKPSTEKYFKDVIHCGNAEASNTQQKKSYNPGEVELQQQWLKI